MANNIPQWAPSKPLIVSDPSKLSYFAKANMTRAGLDAGAAAGAAGAAFGGLRLAGFGAAGTINRIDQVSPATGGALPQGGAGAVNQGGQSVSDFFTRLSQGVGAFFNTPPQYSGPPPVVTPPAETGPLGVPVSTWVIGGVAALGLGYLILRK